MYKLTNKQHKKQLLDDIDKMNSKKIAMKEWCLHKNCKRTIIFIFIFILLKHSSIRRNMDSIMLNLKKKKGEISLIFP